MRLYDGYLYYTVKNRNEIGPIHTTYPIWNRFTSFKILIVKKWKLSWFFSIWSQMSSDFFFFLLLFSFSFSSSSSSFSSFFAYLPSSNLGLTPPGTYKPNVRGSHACRGSNSLWTRTLDRYTRVGLPECVVSTMTGPPPKTTQVRTRRIHTQSQDRN